MRLSVKRKLFISLLSVAIIPLLILSSILYYKTNLGFKSILTNSQNSTKESVSDQLDHLSEELLQLTIYYAGNKELIEAFRTGDRETIAQTVQPIFERLKKEQKLDVFEFGDVNGVVFYRAHNPQKFGDDKSDKPAIQETIKGKEMAGFESGNSGLAVRAFVPLVYENKIIGTLQTGIDSSAITYITKTLKDVNINIMDPEGQILISTDDSKIGTRFKDNRIINKVKAGKEMTREHDHQYEVYMPLLDPTKQEVIGITQIKQDVSIVKTINSQIFLYLLIGGIITIVMVVITAFFLSKSFSTPIKQIRDFMEHISKGNLEYKFKGKNRNDEFGQLFFSIKNTQASLKEMIENISEHSQVVKNQSLFMKESCAEIHISSNQVASTMQELSSGVEQQAHLTTELAKQVNHFSKRINLVNENGTLIQESFYDISNVTEIGNERMNKSIDQMNKIYDIVSVSIEKVKSLDDESKKIANLINVVHNIADQTNLLALNAAIEAARAGEHGKGFAVVANEVRKLAEQVSLSVGEITSIVNGIQNVSKNVAESLTLGYQQVGEGTIQIKETGETFENINKAVVNMAEKIEQVSKNLTEIVYGSNEINKSIEYIATISQESAAGIEETSAAVQQTSSSIERLSSNADSLEIQSDELGLLVGRFRL
ncbi:methyl-accepting chemotaxis protein [Neobacillus sp. LXY-1]|uniref:methyl-accepting chemotaxis protein n=1 Tax=Neobacillus sp. LXY-1 TaxID=3379133 RepID=UPI003EE36E31